ncbi:MAG TPA: chromosome partitioning protein [Gammaproteobacteria bacterium]|nr:chromosome partitioning protein [Gammaproteobacteria bacterium]
MRPIMLLNAKGGCGKTTLATNLAAYFAGAGKQVTLADFDPQGSSMDWLAARPADCSYIKGIAAWKNPLRLGKNTDYVIMDAPARVHGRDLTHIVRKVETLVLPVLPSPIDMRAAAHFVEELLRVGKVERREVKLALVANRVRENTLIFNELASFLAGLKIPLVATLRDTQNYIRAAERGLGIFELPPSSVAQDLEQWTPLLKWLASRRSRP